jgi:hypothetical protein
MHYLFSFFLYLHSRRTGASLVSQHVMAKIKLLQSGQQLPYSNAEFFYSCVVED